MLESCESSLIEYPQANSLIEYEIDDLLNNGEKELLDGRFEEALNFFIQAKDLCKDQENQEMRFFRCTFNCYITHMALDLSNDFEEDYYTLDRLISDNQCSNGTLAPPTEYIANGKPILGPNKISEEECLELVKNTTEYIELILSFAPIKNGWKFSAIASTKLLSYKAQQCCRSGGVWKACLQPLYEKWLKLKDWEKECRKHSDWYYSPDLD